MNREEEAVQILENLIRIDSANPFKTVSDKGKETGVGNEQKIAVYLEQRLKERFIYVARQNVAEYPSSDNRIRLPRFNLIAEKGQGNKSLLFLAHIDTVDVKQGWQTEPFEPTRKTVDGSERIYGLGAYDMKAGIAAILAGIQGIDPVDYKIKVAFVVDEEFWSFGTEKLLESDFLDDVVAAFVPEISNEEETEEKKAITLGRMGRKEYVVTVTGIADHGAKARTSKTAVNAVHESATIQYYLKTEYFCQNTNEFTYGDIRIWNSVFINSHEGGEGYLSIPDKAQFIIDRSFVPGEELDQEIENIKKYITSLKKREVIDHRAKISVVERERPTPSCQPYFFGPEHPFVEFATGISDQYFGSHKYEIGLSVADENRIAVRGIPTVSLGPIGGGCHSNAEWVDINSVAKITEIIHNISGKFGAYTKK